jgi:hypothetical protein
MKDRPWDTKWIIRVKQRRTGHVMAKRKDKQRSTRHYTEKKRSSNLQIYSVLIIYLLSYVLSFIDLLWLSLWYLMACPSLIYSDYPFGILCSVFLWFTLNIPLVSYGLSFIDLLWLSLWYIMAWHSLIYSDYLVGILMPVLLWFTLIIPLVSYGLSFFDLLWLSLWYLMACPSFIYSDYPCNTGIIRINQRKTGHKIPKG